MFNLVRVTQQHVRRSLTRSFAEVLSAPATTSVPPAPLAHNGLNGRVPVREDHGLYAFFRRKDGEDLAGDAKYEVVESPETMQKMPTGRAWKASELRLKSFQDLHTLWYLVLRERNLLATQKEETRRMGVTNTDLQVPADKVHQCRKTMARIKAVINERRLAYEGAVKLAEQQQEEHQDRVLLEYQKSKYKVERRYLIKRREYNERKREARRIRAIANEQQLPSEVAATDLSNPMVEGDTMVEDPPISEAVQPTEPETPKPQPAASTRSAKSEGQSSEDRKLDVGTSKARATPKNPADAAVAGLFGELPAASHTRKR
ncbi:mitochondrial 39-S ribosomal protein L47 (MRP-L47)-domain-containing protein [Infundibulicybe gibba]|nr:mitochondrial 39-S ribosomal protein L47 (MRP-L47)-domain-containing protein [Infundibulicybe gibba]